MLCRYGPDGKLLKSLRTLAETKFMAVSHVWGDAKWRKVKGIEGEVMVSKDKAKFLEQHLPIIVGHGWFWMDVLCIDQKDKAARIAVTQYIPIIFRSAYKTLAVRESWGFGYCCSVARDDIRAYLGGETIKGMVLQDHYETCPDHIPIREEGFLSRIWPLQEIVLSDNIEFIRCEQEIYVEREIKIRPDLNSSLF